MAAPIADKIILPLDTGNTGKKVRTQTRVVGADTVHEHVYVPTRQAQVLGVYRLGMAQQTVLATAQNGTSTAFLWMHVPTAISGKKVRIRKIRMESASGTLLATPSAPRVAVSRFTFTGAASGAQITGLKNDSSYPTHVVDLRTAATGLTVSLVGVIGVLGIAQALTAVGAMAPASIEFIDADNEDEWIVLVPGEGIVLWQDVAGTTSDTRKLNINLIWDEIDVT